MDPHEAPLLKPARMLPAEGYVRLSQILAVYPISRSGWWAGVKSGRYPASVKLGPRITAWRVADIRRLLEHGFVSEANGAQERRRIKCPSGFSRRQVDRNTATRRS